MCVFNELKLSAYSKQASIIVHYITTARDRLLTVATTEVLSSPIKMKLLERMLDSFIRNMVDIDEMQFGFVPGRGTTDAIYIVRQLQE